MIELPPQPVSQNFLREVLNWESRLEAYYVGLASAIQLAFQQADSVGNINPEVMDIPGSMAITLISAARRTSELHEALEQELKRAHRKIAPGELTVVQSAGSLRVVSNKTKTVFQVMPSHVVMMLKTLSREAVWASATFARVFKQPVAGIKGKRSDDVFPNDDDGKRIGQNDEEVLATGQARIYDELIHVGQRKLRRWALRFIFDDSHIAVICWDAMKPLLSPRVTKLGLEEYPTKARKG